MSKYAAVNVKFGADISQFSTAMQNAAREMKKAGDQLKNVGQSMTMNLTAPIVALGAAALYSFGQIDALKRGLISVTGSASLAEEEFTKLREVAKLPGIGLEEAVRGSINLQAIGLSADQAREAMQAFGNAIATIGGGKENFDLAIRGFGQLMNAAKPLQQDLYQIANQLPQINKLLIEAFGTNRAEDLAALGISGKQLADFLVSKLGELPKVSGGIKNSFENMSDSVKVSLASFGEAIEKNFNISGKIDAIASGLSNLVEGFKSLSPFAQGAILSFVGIAAAIGPVLLAIGSIVKILPLLVTGFAGISAVAPWLLAIGAAAVLIYTNWDKLSKIIQNVTTYFKDLYNESILVQVVFQAIATVVNTVLNNIKTFVSTTLTIIKGIGVAFYDLFATIGQGIKDILTGNFAGFGAMLVDFILRLKKDIKEVGKDSSVTFFKPEQIKVEPQPTKTAAPKIGGAKVDKSEIDNKLKEAWANNEAAQNEIALRLTQNDSIARALKGNSEEQIKVIGTGWEGSTQTWAKGVKGFTSAMAIAKGNIMLQMEQLNAEIKSTLQQGMTESIVSAFTQIGENIGMGDDPFKDLGNVLLNSLGKLMSTLGAAMIAWGVAQAAFEVSVSTLNPIGAIAAGAAMVAAGAAISSIASKGLKGAANESGGGYSGGGSSSGGGFTLESRLDGRDLVLAGDNTTRVKRR